MNKRLLQLSSLFVCLALWAAPAAAEDVFPPPWDMSLPNQTFQAWECVGDPVFPGMPIYPLDVENPYGEPTLTFLNAVEIEWIPGPQDPATEVATWHVSEPGGIDIAIENNPDPNRAKLIFWQITSDKSPTPAGDPPTTNPPGTSLPAPNTHKKWPVDDWYTYNGLIKIVPNPEREVIHFDLAPSTNIEEIVIKTICVPEPSSIVLLGVGMAASLAYALRRRRR